MTVFYERFRKVCPQCNTVVHATKCNRSMRLRKVCPQCNTVVHMKRSVCDCCHAFASKKRKSQCTTVGEPENAMKYSKALLSEEELLVTKERDKVRKASKRASKTREQALHRQEQNRTHLACAEGSALQCCSLMLLTGGTISELVQMQLIDYLTQTVRAIFIVFTKLKE